MSAEMLKRVLEERAKVWEQAKALNDTILSESRDYTAEENESYERMNADLSKFDQRIRELKAALEGERSADEARSMLDHDPRPDPKDDKRDVKESDADILRRVAHGELRGYDFRDLTKGTTTAGGYTVPTSFYGQLVEHMIENAAIRQTNVTVLTTDSGENLQVPTTTAHSTGALIGEGSAITESDPAFSQVTLGAFKYAILIQTSSELLEDTGVDLTGYLARQAGRALGNASGAHFITGTGTAQPNGVLTAASSSVTGATGTSGAFTADNLIDLYFSVIAPYRRNGFWLMSDQGVATARKLKDDNSNYLWQPALTSGEPDMLLGKPLVVDTNVDDPATSAESVAFGDFSTYFIRDVRGVRVERSVEYAFNTDLVTWRFIIRTDGDQIDTSGAIKTFVGGAS